MEIIHAILGGFHLSGSPAEKIDKTVAGLEPEQIVPMHCTGFKALRAFSEKMGEKFILYSAGTRYLY